MFRCYLVAVVTLAVVPSLGVADDLPTIVLTPPKGPARMLEAIDEYIKAEDWTQVVEAIQKLLDEDRPFLLPSDKDERHWLSAQFLADARLVTLPKGGTKVYQETFSGQAKVLLNSQPDDAYRAGVTLARFTHTPSGPTLALYLGELNYDQKRWIHAAAVWAGRLDQDNGKDWSTDLLLKAILAFRCASDIERANKAWTALKARANKGEVTFRNRQSKLTDLAREIEAIKTPLAEGEWRLFRGGIDRGGVVAEKQFSLKKAWDVKLAGKATTQEMLGVADLGFSRDIHGLPVSGSPLAVPVMIDKKRQEWLVSRSAAGLRAINAATGEIEWRVESRFDLDRLRTDKESGERVETWVSEVWSKLDRPDLLFGASTLNTLASDGKLVYAIDDLPLPMYYAPDLMKPIVGMDKTMRRALDHNALLAVDVESGKVAWESGGSERSIPAAVRDSFFLGPPLVVDDRVYVVNQQQDKMRLLTFDAKTGELLHTLPLATMLEGANTLLNRRTTAIHLACGGGMLIVPTNGGMVFGVELNTRRLAWGYQYRQVSAPTAAPRWAGSAPMIAGDKVIYGPADDANLFAFDLRTGKLLWKQAGPKDGLYVAGIHNDEVLIAGRKYFQGLKLRDGKASWDVITGCASGFGLLMPGRYVLPVHGTDNDAAGLLVIDLKDHAISKRIEGEKGDLPGNLILCGDRLVSQSGTHLTVYQAK